MYTWYIGQYPITYFKYKSFYSMHNIHAPTQKLSVRTTFVRLRQVPLRINAVKPFLFFLAYCMIFRKKKMIHLKIDR